ncbi:uncharacterized protein [Erythrolamprus reginae]|uniref:uncharacterized protein n=1 Tax=Erythrolamprus reginae TaxID=121349 RepID=UPI00396CE532
MSDNLRSVVGHEDIVREKIGKEVAEGRVLGPFAEPPFPNLRVSPLGVVPKKASGEFRLIHHLSFPKGESVNDFIPDELCSVRYASFDAAVTMVRKCGAGALMGKCDIKSAFRLLPIHPDDFELLGFHFEGGYYVDRALPMGCSVSCSLFESFSTFLEWALRRQSGLGTVVHYLDDFLLAGPAHSEQCFALMRDFEALCAQLGVPLASEKTEGPATRITFLGIELDSEEQSSRLPLEKLVKIKRKLDEVLGCRKVTLRQLQELAGILNFACRVVVPGRAFSRRLYDAMKGLRLPHHRTRLCAGVRADLGVWRDFLERFNGLSFWRHELLLEAELQLCSDAAGTCGFGVVLGDQWCWSAWPPEWSATSLVKDLTFLELFPLIVALELWGEQFRDKTVHFWCDNLAVVHVVNALSSKSDRVMRLVRHFVHRSLSLNALFLAKHVPGLDNGVADALSRGQLSRFRTLAPWARELPEAFPSHLWSLGGIQSGGEARHPGQSPCL